MTANTLKKYKLKDLTQLARKKGLSNWKSMSRESLIKALLRKSGVTATPKTAPKSPTAKISAKISSKMPPAKNSHVHKNGDLKKPLKKSSPAVMASKAGSSKTIHEPAQKQAVPPPKSPQVLKRLQEFKCKQFSQRDLSHRGNNQSPVKDRLVVMVRDPYWLHAYWELSRQSVNRAEAAMAQDWHQARPVLRIHEISDTGSSSHVETVLQDIEIHGGVNNWYIHVSDPPKCYRVDIGYLAAGGRFQMLARSNIVTTPQPNVANSIDENWTDVAQDFDKIYSQSGGRSNRGVHNDLQELFEERLRRPMTNTTMVSPGGLAVEGLLQRRKAEFHFQLDAELIVYGSTESNARITLQNEPIKLRPDGTFTVRYALPNCRQVIPAVAVSQDGLEQRTVVLAIERNTKVMEPLMKEPNC